MTTGTAPDQWRRETPEAIATALEWLEQRNARGRRAG